MLKTLFSLFFLLALGANFFEPSAADAAIASWHSKSALVFPRSPDDLSGDHTRQSLTDLAATGANAVTFVIPWFQSNRFSSDIQRGGNTPTDESLIAAVRFAKSLGLQAAFDIHLDNFEGVWRAEINAADRPAWFRAYGDLLNHYARIAQAEGISLFVVGTELIRMTTSSADDTARWKAMISSVRGLYGGKLSYSANWGPSGFVDEKNRIGFWPDLDFIGISAYFELRDPSNSVEALKRAWNPWNFEHLKPLSDRFGKQVLFTEIGYRSVPGAHTRPWDFSLGGPPDETEQANSYEALFAYWNDFPYMAGVHLWHWETNPNAGGPGSTDYTPQNKKAEQVMTAFFKSNTPAPAPMPPPPGNPSFSTNAAVSPAAPQTGQTTSIAATIHNGSNPAAGTIVDLEIYNSAGGKIFQQFFENQNFAPNEAKTYTVSWNAGGADSYTVKIGVFNNTWSIMHHWNNHAAGIQVGGAPPPPSPGTIDIWWPTEGITVSGVQPFKTVLSGRTLSDYQMFWQVDGGQLNFMPDNLADFPHKEVMVDLSGWSWRGTGPYVLNFVAKSTTGAILGERIINIFVAR